MTFTWYVQEFNRMWWSHSDAVEAQRRRHCFLVQPAQTGNLDSDSSRSGGAERCSYMCWFNGLRMFDRFPSLGVIRLHSHVGTIDERLWFSIISLQRVRDKHVVSSNFENQWMSIVLHWVKGDKNHLDVAKIEPLCGECFQCKKQR